MYRASTGGFSGGLEALFVTIRVTTYESTLFGKACELSKSGIIIKRGFFNSSGICEFKGLQVEGEYKVYASDGSQDNYDLVSICYEDICKKNY